MKKTLLALVVILIVGIAVAYAQNPGMMGGQGWNYCPYCGQSMGQGMMGGGMMGRGMMGGCGMMGGQGMMGPGYGQQQPQQYQLPQYQQPQKPLEEKDAKEILENYIKNIKNPNLKLGKIKDTGNAFEAEIVTKENSLVDKIIVDKATGWMRSAY
ncbi:MAG: hypothetical protein A2Z47_01985 [Thermodesulfovibrio sp. RBG_19FT_COMBO_42_12]|nr:MAG: hypothetical protein A2Z47_01985 [Thermodesulfovibrio sp. RBG_19FT_COMBO_42_12]